MKPTALCNYYMLIIKSKRRHYYDVNQIETLIKTKISKELIRNYRIEKYKWKT
jgi:hypothetical protein